MIRLAPAVLLSAMFLASCASDGAGAPSAEQTVKSESVGAEGEIVLGAITESALPKGECGMILWTLESDRPTPIFRYVAAERAEMMIDGAPVNLTLTRAAGSSGFGVSEDQEFVGPSGLKASVKARFGMGFDGGSYLEQGLVTVENEAGWRAVIPAAGVAGCRQK